MTLIFCTKLPMQWNHSIAGIRKVCQQEIIKLQTKAEYSQNTKGCRVWESPQDTQTFHIM